jgi:hypothetical protein
MLQHVRITAGYGCCSSCCVLAGPHLEQHVPLWDQLQVAQQLKHSLQQAAVYQTGSMSSENQLTKVIA